MSLAIFFSLYGKASGADLTHASQICPFLELSISRQPLSKDMPLKDAVWHTIMPQGDILPNVENLVNPAMLLESETFHRLLNEASEEYRYIFIDAPPLDLVSDGEKIGSLCDGAILVVASGKVSRGMVQNSIHQLERAGCPLLGIVLNRVEDQRKKNYYQKYGYYASEKGKKK